MSIPNNEIRKQLLTELSETIHIKQLNLDLMDSLESTTLFLMLESEKNGIKLPNLDRLDSLLHRVWTLYTEINRKFTERGSTADYTEPIIWNCQVVVGFYRCQKPSVDLTR